MNAEETKKAIAQTLKSIAYQIALEELNTLDLDELDRLMCKLARNIEQAQGYLKNCYDY